MFQNTHLQKTLWTTTQLFSKQAKNAPWHQGRTAILQCCSIQTTLNARLIINYITVQLTGVKHLHYVK